MNLENKIIIKNELMQDILNLGNFTFLDHLDEISKTRLLELMEKIIPYSGNFEKIQIKNFKLYQIYNKNPKAYDLFWDKQQELKNNSEIIKEISYELTNIIIDNVKTIKADPTKIYNFLMATEKKVPDLDWSYIRDIIVVENLNKLFELMIEKEKIAFNLNEDLNYFFRNLNLNSLQNFLNHFSDFYVEYGKKHKNLGYGYLFCETEEITKKITLMEEYFKNHKDFNHKEWLWNIFNQENFQKNVISYNNFGDDAKKAIQTALEENPEFFTKAFTNDFFEKNFKERNITTLKEFLGQYHFARPLLEIHKKQENEKIIKSKITSHLENNKKGPRF